MKGDQATTAPTPWTASAGYDSYPPLPDDDWDVSSALERSLLAYVPQPAH